MSSRTFRFWDWQSIIVYFKLRSFNHQHVWETREREKNRKIGEGPSISKNCALEGAQQRGKAPDPIGNQGCRTGHLGNPPWNCRHYQERKRQHGEGLAHPWEDEEASMRPEKFMMVAALDNGHGNCLLLTFIGQFTD